MSRNERRWKCIDELISTGFNSLWLSGAIWRHRTESTLIREMAHCFTATSHCLNQRWLLIYDELWHWPENNLTGNAQATTLCDELESYALKIIDTSPRGQRVNHISRCKYPTDPVWTPPYINQRPSWLIAARSHYSNIINRKVPNGMNN